MHSSTQHIIIQLNNNAIIQGLVPVSLSYQYQNRKYLVIQYDPIKDSKTVLYCCCYHVTVQLLIVVACHLNVRHVRLNVPIPSAVLLASIRTMLTAVQIPPHTGISDTLPFIFSDLQIFAISCAYLRSSICNTSYGCQTQQHTVLLSVCTIRLQPFLNQTFHQNRKRLFQAGF